ncbi:MAG: hypothetical protein J1E34_08845 [Oscillospiraceae bacterium]|nr:hypothetical protein [Oscillospiraceae bacterium]
MGQGRNWTAEEDEYLSEFWGTVPIDSIAKHLHRSKNAILIRKERLGLGAFLDGGDYVSLNQLMLTLFNRPVHRYDITSYVENRGLPVRYQRVGNCRFRVVKIDEFWKWAEKNVCFLDFSRFEENALGAEPAWVADKRSADCIRSYQIKTTPWTPLEDDKLRHLLEMQKYGYTEIAQMLQRTEGAVVRRISDLGIKERAVKADNHQLWTDEDFRQLSIGIKAFESYEQIQKRIPYKSSKAIRGRVYKSYLTENLDKVRAMIGKDDFGDNLPEKKIGHFRLMSPEERDSVKGVLSALAGDLLQLARMKSGVSEEYSDYWQKDMCQNWNDIFGCEAGEKCCDSCISFCRIKAQYCKRCGFTVLSRKAITFCDPCKEARKKSAQKKWAVLNARKNLRKE